jgi:lysophospholipid acyltransferase (LPLAT)-like uncharacterized protein
VAKELQHLALLHGHSLNAPGIAARELGRNRFTETIDALLSFVKKHLPPVHRTVVQSVAFLLFGYLRWVGATAKLTTQGSFQWPDIPQGSVLVIWHGSAPSLLAAFAAKRPSTPLQILVACDARGDCLAAFCRLLGFEVVRGDAAHEGWEALAKIALRIGEGTSALITTDGGGPALVAKMGAVALASAGQMPLIPIGADCRPATFERHKWDAARNPLPYARIAVVCGEAIMLPFLDATSLEGARQHLQDVLDDVSRQARITFDFPV